MFGCYFTNGKSGKIAIQSVTDDRFQGVMEVTAAHEMLHAAYSRLSPSDRDKLTPQLKQAALQVQNDRLSSILKQYKQKVFQFEQKKSDYNQKVQEFNDQVREQKERVAGFQQQFDIYKQKVDDYNAIAHEEKALFTDLKANPPAKLEAPAGDDSHLAN